MDKDQIEPAEEQNLVEDFLTRNQINYPVALSNESQNFTNYGIRTIPTLVIINKEGNVEDFRIGSNGEKNLEEKITELINK